MRPTSNKILKTVFTTFILFNLTFGQTIMVDGERFKLDPDTRNKMSMLVDSLAGTWQLERTIRYEDGDTIIQEPTTRLWLSPGAEAWTKIVMDSLRNFEIEQACMKCPQLYWTGQYEIEIRTYDGLGYFYLNFIDDRVKESQSGEGEEALIFEFNGHLINFGNAEMILLDKDGREWVYSFLGT